MGVGTKIVIAFAGLIVLGKVAGKDHSQLSEDYSKPRVVYNIEPAFACDTSTDMDRMLVLWGAGKKEAALNYGGCAFFDHRIEGVEVGSEARGIIRVMLSSPDGTTLDAYTTDRMFKTENEWLQG